MNLKDIYCLEFSEYSNKRGMYPFHYGTLDDAIKHNIRDMYYGNRGENKWQIVYVGTAQGCLDAIKYIEDGRLTPVAPDRAEARDSDDESPTRAAGEHDG